MYRELLESIFNDAVRADAVRDKVDSHFAAQTVIGICNAWGELIVRDPELDIFELTQKVTELLLRGFGK
jgi:hypothetical protein